MSANFTLQAFLNDCDMVKTNINNGLRHWLIVAYIVHLYSHILKTGHSNLTHWN